MEEAIGSHWETSGANGSQQRRVFVRVKYEQEPLGAIGSRLKRGSNLPFALTGGCGGGGGMGSRLR